MRVVDLFAGTGGFSLGAEQAGCQVEHAVELDDWACETLIANHEGTDVHKADIRNLSDSWFRKTIRPYPDLLIGGPPCQGFSRAGPAEKDPKDPRNSLFREFVRAARVLQPRIVIMENVPGILRAKTSKRERVTQIVEGELQKLGYETRILVVDAEKFGVPQVRTRVFFVGAADFDPPDAIVPTHGGESDLFGNVPRDVLTLRDAISDLPIVDVGFKESVVPYVGPPQNDFQRAMREGAPSMLENHLPMKHSARTVERFKQIRPGQSQSHVSADHAPKRRLRSEDDGPGVYDQNNRRMHWDRPCHTLAASFYANFVHPALHRNFTPREGARIQTFPDWYIFKGKPTVVSMKLLTREGRDAEKHLCQYNQIGNAVPPVLGRVLIQEVLSRVRMHDEVDSVGA